VLETHTNGGSIAKKKENAPGFTQGVFSVQNAFRGYQPALESLPSVALSSEFDSKEN